MRLTFFFSTVAFCFFAAIACFALFKRRASAAALGRERGMERMLFAFSLLLACWSFGTAFFVSSPSEEEALRWFRAFAFSWYLAPGTFVLFAYAQSGRRIPAPSAILSFAPGAAALAAHLADPSSVVLAAPAIAGGRHVVYADSIWSALVSANTVLVPLAAVLRLSRTAFGAADPRRRSQAAVVLAFFAPTFAFSVATGVVARLFDVAELPPLTPAFFVFLVVGLYFAVFKYGLLELTPTSAAKRIWSSVSDGVVLVSAKGEVIDSNLPGASRGGGLAAFVEGAPADPEDWLSGLSEPRGDREGRFAFEAGAFRDAALRVRTVGDDALLGGYVVAARDLSAEKSLARESALSSERAAALRSAEENFAQVFRQSPAGMLIVETRTSVILDMNEAACRVAAGTREDLIGRDLWSLGFSLPPAVLRDIRESLGADRSVGTREVRLRRSGAEALVFAITAAPFTFEGRASALVSFIDISELSFLRRELFKAQKTESIGAMAAGLAHDFNNILTAVMGNVSLARLSVEGDGEISDALAGAETACARARELSRQLLIYAHGGLSEPKAEDVFAIAIESSRMALSGASISVSFESEPTLPNASIDRPQIAMLFNNLALNAAAAMPSDGTLRVRGSLRRVDAPNEAAAAPGEYLCVEFSDEGEGIAPEYLSRVFDPYVNAKKKLGGLALAICETIAKRHGGWIAVDSAPGKGNTFSVFLPALKREPAAAASDLEREPPLRMGKGSILLMDDDFAIRTMAQRLLSRLGYESKVVSDGPAAVAAFKAARSKGFPFRAVILDLTIAGGMDGVETASLLRAEDPAVPIYLSTGYEGGPAQRDFSSYGFSGVIPKPYTLEELSDRLLGVR